MGSSQIVLNTIMLGYKQREKVRLVQRGGEVAFHLKDVIESNEREFLSERAHTVFGSRDTNPKP